jgi:proteasome lid subunit RPN8/RPN11
VIELPASMVEAIVAHARRDHPDECCGVIAGRDGAATRLFEMENAERSPTGFVFDSGEWLRVYREMDDADEEPLAVYHSHTATEAYPSRTDITWSKTAGFPHWVLVSTRSEELELRSFTIDAGVVTEEELRVT